MGNLYFSDFKVVSTINNIKIIYKILKEHSFVDSLELVDDNTIKGDNKLIIEVLIKLYLDHYARLNLVTKGKK